MIIDIIICCFLFSSLNGQKLDINNPVVNTRLGLIRGLKYESRSKFTNRNIISFIGVPYARKMTPNDRFKPPIEPGPWDGELNAQSHRVMCPQVEQRFNFFPSKPIREDEDCLYLNIFVPDAYKPTLAGFPVMFYIHGGEFKFGGKDFYGPDYLLDNDVILVTINYRLGILGFLSTNDGYVPGNLGIHDQIAALRWVSAHIEHFGGNRDNITVFGHDAGAISASMLQFAVSAWQLFHKLIVLGDSIFSPNALSPNPMKEATHFARLNGCSLDKENQRHQFTSSNLSVSIVNCLREKTVNELMAVSRTPGIEPSRHLFWFRPTIDRNSSNPILINLPEKLYPLSNLWAVPLMVGLTVNEGSLDYFTYYDKIMSWPLKEKLEYVFGQFQRDPLFQKILIESINWFYFKRWNSTEQNYYSNSNYVSNQMFNPNPLHNKIQSPFHTSSKYQSFGADQDWQQLMVEERKLINALGDLLFAGPVVHLASWHSRIVVKPYLYVFEHRGLKSFGPLQKNVSSLVHREQYGVTHMDDAFYLFPTEYNQNATSSFDEPIIKSLCQHFAHFAQHGAFVQGQSPSSVGRFSWLPYDDEKQAYVRVGQWYGQVFQQARAYRSDYLSFWNSFVREVLLPKMDEQHDQLQPEQISAQFFGTVQLHGAIRFGNHLLNIV